MADLTRVAASWTIESPIGAGCLEVEVEEVEVCCFGREGRAEEEEEELGFVSASAP